ncbi:hypothetical protein [Leifsonia shinshuensis]|uniref:Uncharacterized protein n=1 Tax=Leifsonia shinshuensis TaxID=150026 RepID=A0A853CTW6_9MICO|nr:hypothetical protein [Leifsonia shinshuensis]NYJ22260.1 hypothetical protein [Leifsonia shinshuensis]
MTDSVQFDGARSRALEQALADRVRFDSSGPQVRARRRRLVLTTALIAGAAIVGVGASAAVIGAPGWIALPGTHPGAPSYGSIPAWPRNANGQTYGQQGSSPVAPDLIEVEGEDANGKPVTGYVLSSQLAEAEFGGPEPTSPAQALEQQRERLRKYPDGQWLPVYRSDGVTRVGRFLVGPGT